MNESYLTERGLYYRTNQFSKERETLVFVHGLSGSSSAWIQYEEYFGERYNIVTFDLRGHGKSFRPKVYKDYDISLFADDLRTLLSHLSVDTFVLIAHSFGAAVALEFMLSNPGRARSAVFLSPDIYIRKNRPVRLFFPLIGWITNIANLFVLSDKRGGHVDYARYLNTGDWNLRRITRDVFNTGLWPYLYTLKHLYRFDREKQLGDIKVPILLIHGTKDSMVPYDNSAQAVEKIYGSRLITLPGAHHVTILNNFSEISQALDEFLKV